MGRSAGPLAAEARASPQGRPRGAPAGDRAVSPRSARRASAAVSSPHAERRAPTALVPGAASAPTTAPGTAPRPRPRAPLAASAPRRAVLLALGALAGCGFAPALAPGGRGRFAVEAPDTRAGFVLRGRLLDRLGTPGADAPYRLAFELAIDPEVAAVDPAQVTTRVRLEGAATFALTQTETGRVVLRGSASSFASYDTTGTTVSLAASARDAETRLAVILADRIAARLLAADLP